MTGSSAIATQACRCRSKKIGLQRNNLFPGVGATFLLVVCLSKYFNLTLVMQTSNPSCDDQLAARDE